MLNLERRPTRRRIYMQVKPETKEWIEEKMAALNTKVSYGLVVDALVDQAREAEDEKRKLGDAIYDVVREMEAVRESCE